MRKTGDRQVSPGRDDERARGCDWLADRAARLVREVAVRTMAAGRGERIVEIDSGTRQCSVELLRAVGIARGVCGADERMRADEYSYRRVRR